jgi:hypothetical protein
MTNRLIAFVHGSLLGLTRRGDEGQTTAEYALVILGAAAIALLVIAWAAQTGKVSTLLNKIVDSVAGNV